jgi:adenine-specific DNA-methyltransferase
MYENLTAIKAVMSDSASIYVHLDWHIGHYVKILLDEVFGEENFVNEIVWCYSGPTNQKNNFPRKHDTIYLYAKDKSDMFFDSDSIRVAYKKSNKSGGKTGLAGRSDEASLEALDERGKIPEDWWPDIADLGKVHSEDLGYPTQKPEALLERILNASTKKGCVVADFFGGSGVTAKVAHALGRRFVHSDIGQNSIQTARDRLADAGAAFDVLRVQDGVQLFRNPAQTMAKLKGLIPGLTRAQSAQPLPDYWAGIFASQGAVPVALPNLLDSASRVFDEAALHKLTMEELPKLADWDYPVENVVVYTIDVADPQACAAWLHDHNPTGIAVELRDLKPLLTDLVLGDELQAHVEPMAISQQAGPELPPDALLPSGTDQPRYRVVVQRYHSDYLARKLAEVVSKKALQPSALVKQASQASQAGQPLASSLPVGLSQDGLECLEWLSLDCEAAEGPWHSTVEVRIDMKNRLIQNGVRQSTPWDGTLLCAATPKRLRVRNVAGDECTVVL